MMQSVSFCGANGLCTCLLALLMLSDSVVTSSRQKEMLMNALRGKRFDVAPRDVIARSSATRCAVACRDTSWCVSANLQTGDGTCQLLSEEVSDDDESLQSADGWRYLRTWVLDNWRSGLALYPCMKIEILIHSQDMFSKFWSKWKTLWCETAAKW